MILVTGAAGFIGYHICITLIKLGYDVIAVDSINDYYSPLLKLSRLNNISAVAKEERDKGRQAGSFFTYPYYDISNYVIMETIFNRYNINTVINMAAQTGVRYSVENPFAYQRSNLEGFLSVLELCRHNNVKNLIYASSSSVYGKNVKLPFSEKDELVGQTSLYGATKRANELMAQSYSEMYGLKTTGLRFFTVYGPWGRPDMAMWIFTEAINKGKPITVFNNGKMKRDFTYVDDIVNGVVSCVKTPFDCEIFNLGNSKSEKLMDVVKIIEENLSKSANITYSDGVQLGDIKETHADVSHANRKLGFLPVVDIEEGIEEFIDWYTWYELNQIGKDK